LNSAGTYALTIIASNGEVATRQAFILNVVNVSPIPVLDGYGLTVFSLLLLFGTGYSQRQRRIAASR
jgi:hypothetical protein